MVHIVMQPNKICAARQQGLQSGLSVWRKFFARDEKLGNPVTAQ